mgnify:CR=1 FL=1
MAINPFLLDQYLTPGGKNDGSSLANFERRKFYKEFPYFGDLPNPMDSWYDKLYYGRVDRTQNGIVISDQAMADRLVQIKSTKNVFVLDFVADAFADFHQHMRAASTSGYINNAGTRFNILEPVRGWKNYQTEFSDSRQHLRSAVQSYFRREKRADRAVTGFKAFLNEFINFLELRPLIDPVTLSGFVVSNSSHPMMSGLSIELTSDDHGDDTPKVTKYMLDPNFDYYVRAARKYGFYVHRNAPWKLTADVFSDKMLSYLDVYGANESNFFSHYYDRSYTKDIQHMKEDLVSIYNSYVTAFPLIRTEKPPFGPGNARVCQNTTIENKLRESITMSAVDSIVGDGYWLDFYFRLRLREKNLDFNNINTEITNALQINKVQGLEIATKYVNDQVKPYLY